MKCPSCQKSSISFWKWFFMLRRYEYKCKSCPVFLRFKGLRESPKKKQIFMAVSFISVICLYLLFFNFGVRNENSFFRFWAYGYGYILSLVIMCCILSGLLSLFQYYIIGCELVEDPPIKKGDKSG